jgi:CheY-like chemotaxis protein
MPIGEKTAKDLRSFRYVTKREDVDIARSWMPRVKVLVVDDMKVNIKVAQGQLKLYGLEIDTASSGQKAIELIKRHDYDLVFMDHMMPEMDGIKATSIIRDWENEQGLNGQGKQVPIIALTANAVSGMKEKFLRKGFNDFLAKPIDVFKLDEILKRWIPREKSEPGPENMESEEAEKKMLILVDDDIENLRLGRDWTRICRKRTVLKQSKY